LYEPGGTATLTGLRLLFSQADPKQGIFLTDSAKNVYRVEQVLSHTGKKVVFMLPDSLPFILTAQGDCCIPAQGLRHTCKRTAAYLQARPDEGRYAAGFRKRYVMFIDRFVTNL
jgi:hypothetical protein